jgi:hypothetical protein
MTAAGVGVAGQWSATAATERTAALVLRDLSTLIDCDLPFSVALNEDIKA